MSLRARLTLATSVAFTASTIWFVHWNQNNEQEVGFYYRIFPVPAQLLVPYVYIIHSLGDV